MSKCFGWLFLVSEGKSDVFVFLIEGKLKGFDVYFT